MTNLLEMRNQDRRRKRRYQDHSRRAWYREQRSRQLLPSQNLAKGPRAAVSIIGDWLKAEARFLA